MNPKPSVTIGHTIPGRLRVHLSIAPPDPEGFIASIKGHAGLDQVAYTPVTRSVLTRFDPWQITREEVVMRIALALSLCHGETPVQVFRKPESEVLTNTAAAAGLVTGAAVARQWLSGGSKATLFAKLAALATGGAIVEHGWRETREQGYFDPEVLSLTYLAAALLRGDYARGAFITWMIAFGRHLLAAAPEGVEIRPMRRESDDGSPPRYEIAIVPGVSQQAPLFQVLQSFVRYFAADGGPGQAGLIKELRTVSSAHGEMVEGLGWMRDDIPLHFG
jgi:hypothetical protein